QAHDPDPAGARRGGDGNDRVAVVVHGRQFRRPRCPRPALRRARAGQLFSTTGLGGGSAYFLVITHCCSRPSPPLATWYSTRPAGRKARITPKISGMVCIIFCCIGSMPVIGVSFCVAHMIAMLSTGRMKYGSRAV